MSVLAVSQNARPAFLGLKQRRNIEGVSIESFFDDVIAIFGGVFAKSESFIVKIKRNWEVFYVFEKGTRVFALIYVNPELASKIRTYSGFP